MERLGIFGGSFDPPHRAHLALARQACRELHLSRVLWVLTPDPPHKDRPDLTPYPLRRKMLQAALAGHPEYELCEVEAERPGPHYTVDTVRILRERNPGAEIYLLLGEDSLRDLPTWDRPGDLLPMCTLAVMRRAWAAADPVSLEKALPGISARTHLLKTAMIDISSTDIRERVRTGVTIHKMVPRPVEKIILSEGVYLVHNASEPNGKA
jgi:nicotinate-nucleotide adenylyltransferase